MNSFESAKNPSIEMNETPSLPESLQRRLAEGKVVELDVRPLLAAGQEPFQQIMRAVDGARRGGVFKLIVPFEPVPLYAVLGRKGFQHFSRNVSEEVGEMWEILFYQEEETEEPATPEFAGEEESAVALDVRGLEPPEPMERVLEAAEALSYGDVLRVTHHRNPLILFDILDERGFQHRSEQKDKDLWEIRVWRKG